LKTAIASKVEGPGKYRKLHGLALLWQRVMCIILAVMGVSFILGVHTTFRLAIFQEQYLSLFLALVLASIFLGVRPSRNSAADRVPWYDIVLMVCGLGVGTYTAIYYPGFVMTSIGIITPARLVVGLLMILLTLEAVRRVIGWSVVMVVCGGLLYANFKYLFPGLFGGRGIPWDTLINYLYLDPNALFSMVGIAATRRGM